MSVQDFTGEREGAIGLKKFLLLFYIRSLSIVKLIIRIGSIYHSAMIELLKTPYLIDIFYLKYFFHLTASLKNIPLPFQSNIAITLFVLNVLNIEDIVDIFIDNNLLMLANRLQSIQPLTSLLFQTNFGFATKNLKQIKIRMKAVESIKKITKAMKMVAASKMKQDVGRLERAKFYGVGTVQRIIANETYLAKKKANFTAKKWLLVPLTSDKGLCGGVNSSIIREVKAMVKEDRNAYKIFTVGDKGSVALSRPMADILDSAITHIITPINFPTAASIAYQAIEHAKDCDRVMLVYNQFKNVISQIQRKVQIMNRTQFGQQFKFVTKHDPDSMAQHSDLFYDFYISSIFYHAILNNVASEQSSRMNAMENASKNAGEILTKLTLDYNKARQAKITMELCEIISGAAAV